MAACDKRHGETARNMANNRNRPYPTHESKWVPNP